MQRLRYAFLLVTACVIGFFGAQQAFGLDSWATWTGAQPLTSKQIPPHAMVARGSGTNAYYVMEVDPTTGALPVSGTFTLTYDTNYGTVGANTLRTAAILGVGTTAVSNSNPVPISDAGGSITVDGTVAATQSGTWTVQPGNTANTTAWLVKQNGNAYVTSVRNVYSSVNVDTTTWVQLVASTSGAVNCLTIFDGSGQTMELGTGAAASETRVLIIPPGGISGCVPLRIAASTRVAIRAISATASVNELDITMLQ